MRSKAQLILFFVLVLTVLAGFFVYPKGLGSKFLPWNLGLDLVGGTYLVYEVDMSAVAAADRSSVMNGLRDVLEKRVNVFGVSEPRVTTAKQGDSYQITVELAGIKDVQAAINQIGRTAQLEFREVKASSKEGEVEFLPSKLTGRYLKTAQMVTNPQTGLPQIAISFDKEGSRLFEEMSIRSIGKPIGILLDGNIISIPVVQEKIAGGEAQISGQFTFKEAQQLVSLLNAGALPAPVKVISQQTIGPSLGLDSLNKALFAGLIGTLAIILFMLLYYHRLGIFAALALVIYIILTLAVFKLLGITMTLSGIAGFILSIGMAVDANILVFARTKEEVKKGAPFSAALEEGFKRAWTSIRDSNISTILTSVILYYFTSSFVRGFALALLVGVLMSMFSAITVTRAILRSLTK